MGLRPLPGLLPLYWDQPELDRQYSARGTVPDAEAEIAQYRSRTEAVQARVAHRAGIPYGPSEPERLDVYPAAPAHASASALAPVFVFIHGGYWRALDAAESGFMAEAMAGRGICTVAVNYALSPMVSLDEIVRQCRAAISWVRDNIAAHGGDPARIHVGGSSAGAHLAAMLAASGSEVEHAVAGLTLLSGLYDLAYVPRTHVNAWLRLDDAAAERNSPLWRLPRPGLPVVGRLRPERDGRVQAAERGVLRRLPRRRLPGGAGRRPRHEPFQPAVPARGRRVTAQPRGARCHGRVKGQEGVCGEGLGMRREPMTVGIAGLGAIGLEVARRLDAGVPGFRLLAVASRSAQKAEEAVRGFAAVPEVTDLAGLAAADVVIEAAPAAAFADVARPAIAAGRILLACSGGALMRNMALAEEAERTGARIIVPTGALLGLDAVRAAAQGGIASATIESRKAPRGWKGAPYVEEHGIVLDGLTRRCASSAATRWTRRRASPRTSTWRRPSPWQGSGRSARRWSCGPTRGWSGTRTRSGWEADVARFTMTIEGVPNPTNPRTGLLTPLSVIACLRGLRDTVRIGS